MIQGVCDQIFDPNQMSFEVKFGQEKLGQVCFNSYFENGVIVKIYKS